MAGSGGRRAAARPAGSAEAPAAGSARTGLVRERLAAAAGVLRARVRELEPRALQADDVVDRDPLEVHRAHRIDVDADAVLLERQVAVALGVLEVHGVLE